MHLQWELELARVVDEIETFVAAAGWDQPPRLFALVPTSDLLTREPQLARAIGVSLDDAGAPRLTPVEQDDLPDQHSIEDLLAAIAWPDEVAGTALVLERLVVPPAVEQNMPAGEAEALEFLATHPLREEMRLTVSVLRDGTTASIIRLRSQDDDDRRLRGPDLAPGLAAALASTLS